MGKFFLEVKPKNETNKKKELDNEDRLTVEVLGPTVRFTNLTVEEAITLETGYQDKNEWLEWLIYTANSAFSLK